MLDEGRFLRDEAAKPINKLHSADYDFTDHGIVAGTANLIGGIFKDVNDKKDMANIANWGANFSSVGNIAAMTIPPPVGLGIGGAFMLGGAIAAAFQEGGPSPEMQELSKISKKLERVVAGIQDLKEMHEKSLRVICANNHILQENKFGYMELQKLP